MLEKRSVCCGAPVYIVRQILLPYFVMLGVIAVFFFGSLIKEGTGIIDLWFDSIYTGIALLGFPIVAFGISTALFYIRLSRYMTHFKKHDGRVCFLCNYPLEAEPTRCPECGTIWAMEELNADWKSRVEHARKDSDD